VSAVTRRAVGDGVAWYVATRPDPATTARLLAQACADAGVSATAEVPRGVEVVRRRRDDDSYLFVLNHTNASAPVTVHGTDLVTGSVSGADTGGRLTVPPGGVAVVHESKTAQGK
jgi:beta-galactosidase